MKNTALYLHGGSDNRGCEAIVRTTSAMLRSNISDSHIRLYSFAPEQDRKAVSGAVDDIVACLVDGSNFSVGTVDKLKIMALSKLSSAKADEFYFGKFYENCLPIKEDELFISIGGDNYCYGDNTTFNAFNRALKRLDKKTVLWGCSLDENSFTDYICEDLQRYDKIFVRESISRALFEKHGFKENVFMHSDPAFTLPAEMLPLPEGFCEGNTIGINISPLIFKYESATGKGMGFAAMSRLCEYIISETDSSIAFIPHVFWKSSNDLEPLKKLNEQFRDSGRTVLLDGNYNAEQLKGYIARCRAFVGARTHATIAAYSSCVPTLVLGYSVKSRGIATDIFGTDEGFVVPVQSLTDERALLDSFKSLMSNEQSIKNTLSEQMPNYIRSAFDAGKMLAKWN